MWYFGTKAGLDFNATGNQPVPSVLANSAMVSSEGCSNICDSDGKLLFYSNGTTVYNRNHQVMLNGDNLKGNTSAVQSCIIVPYPGNDSLFYIFTTDAIENSFANGYNYSVVNKNRDNGNGEVIIKNVLLWQSCSERMTAARHANGIDVWLITNDNNSNIFRSWLINCNGLAASPIVSTTGIVMDQHYTSNTGMLKVSPDGNQLCQTHFPDFEGSGTANFCQLFSFDNLTGMISNPKTITLPNSKVLACEYSPDSRLLYLTNPSGKSIEQIEPTLNTTSNIVASRITISTGNMGYYGIQLAPDRKIYLAEISTTLGVINRPDVKGNGCNYNANQITLTPGGSSLGLPASINDLSVNSTNGFTYSIIDSCTGRVQFNGITTMSGAISWAWDFGDGNTSTLQNPVHTFTPAGSSYKVQVTITSASGCGKIVQSKNIFPGGLAATADFDFTSNCDAGIVRFINNSTLYPDSSGARFVWNFDDGNTSTATNPVHTFSRGGIYNVRLDVITTTPCLNRSITKTLNLDVLNITATANQEIEAGQSIQLNVTGGGNSFRWYPATWLSNDSIANPVSTPNDNIRYKVVVKNDAGCSDSAYVSIKVLPFPGIYMPTGFTPNNDGVNDAIKPIITKEFSLQNFSIYNRWGQKVFSTSEREAGWNGKLKGMTQDAGVYVWIINATDTRSGIKYEKKGTFVIIR